MAFGTKVAFEPIRSVAAGSITGSYAAVGGAFGDHMRLVSITNTTNQPIFISFNGVDDHLFLQNASFELLDLSTNRVRDDGLFLAQGTFVFARYVGTLGSTGTLYIASMYAAGGK